MRSFRPTLLVVLLFTAWMSPGITRADDVTLSGVMAFQSLDGSPDDHDGVANGVFTVDDGNLVIDGTIQCNDGPPLPGNASACPIAIVVSGDLTISAGGALLAENQQGSGSGGDITLTVGGNLVLQGPASGLPGAVISSSRTSGGISGGVNKAGKVRLSADGSIDVEAGSVVAANALDGLAGAVEIAGQEAVSISGLVSSGPSRTVLATKLAGKVLAGDASGQVGGPITVTSSGRTEPAITVGTGGIVVSQGETVGADRVTLSGCGIEVRGLVASVSKRSGPSEVSLLSGKDILVDGRDLGAAGPSAGRFGRLRADATLESAQGYGVDLFANGTIEIHGPAAGGLFAASSNPGTQSKSSGGTIRAISLGSTITASGNAFEAGRSQSGNKGGSISLAAQGDVGLDGATLKAIGDLAAGKGAKGGAISVRSYQEAVSWTFGVGDVRPVGTGIGASGQGSIVLTACTGIDTTGSQFPVIGSAILPFPVESEGVCAPAAPSLPAGTLLPECDAAPVAVDDSATVVEDSEANTIDVLANDTDTDGGPKTIASATDPANGTVVVAGDNLSLTYTPDANYCNTNPGGTPDTFTYTLNPGGDTATVSVTVTCVDDDPTAVDDTATVAEDSGPTTIDVLANDTDPDGGTKTIASATDPANGTVVVAGDNLSLTYQPDADYCNTNPGGTPDTFTYTLNPGGDTATVSVTVTCADDNPTAVNDSATVAEDSGANPIDVLANDTDPDGGTKTIASATDPTNGTVVVAGDGLSLTYAPDANYCNTNPGGTPDTFSYTLTQGGSSATVSVTVTCVDDNPTAVADTATVNEDSGANPIDVLANDTDPDGGPKTIASATDPANGTVVVAGDGLSLTYAPDANYCNTNPGGTPDTFSYTLTQGGSSATVTVTVTCVDDNPTAVADAATVVEDSGANTIDVLANDTDPDGGPKTIASATDPANGTVVVAGDGLSLTYAPDANYCNSVSGIPDTFSYTVNGGSSATVTVTVTCVDDDPTAVNDTATVNEDSGANTINVLANDTDPDGGSKTIASATDPANGTVVVAGDGLSLTYAPDADYCNSVSGIPDTFNYTLVQGGSSATVTVTVTCVNDQPTAVDDAAATNEDTVISILVRANDTDPDIGDTLTIVAIGGSPAATVTHDGSAVSYDPRVAFNSLPQGSSAIDTFTYTIQDSGGLQSTATVTVNVAGLNDAPNAVDDTYSGIGNTQLAVEKLGPFGEPTFSSTLQDVLSNDVDPDTGDTPAVQVFSGALPSGAVLDIAADGTFFFTPPPGATSATFTYTVEDDLGATDTAQVTVNLVKMVWYVDNTENGGTVNTGKGTSTEPFSTLSDGAGNVAPDDAEDAALAGHYIYVHKGSGTTNQDKGIVLKDQQKLLGEGVSLVIDPDDGGAQLAQTLFTGNTANKPQVTNSTGNAVTVLANTGNNRLGLEIRGLSLSSTGAGANAIDVTSVNAASLDVRISENTVTGAPAEGIDITLGSTDIATLAVFGNTLTAAGTALDIQRTAGTVVISRFENNVVSGATGGSGIVVTGPVTFDGLPATATLDLVGGGATVIGTPGDAVGGAGLVLGSVTGRIDFGDLDVFAGGGAGFAVSGTGAFTGAAGTQVTVPSGMAIIEATGGPAVALSSLTTDLQLSSLKSTNSSTTGVSLDAIGGTFSAGPSSTITSSAGTAFRVNGSNATVSYAGTISTNTGTGVSLTGNTGSTMSFTGTMTLSTGTNPAFTATGGGTVTATDTASTLTTTTATALNVANTTIGAGGLKFRSISAGTAASGPTNGIVLNNTGASGGLTVSGTGSAGSGGTIQRAATGISLTNTRQVSIAFMQLNDHSDFAIRGSSVVGFTMNNTVINGTNGNDAGADEGSVRFTELTGSATISNSSISGAVENNFTVVNTAGTLNRITFTNTTFGANSNAAGDDGLLIEGQNAAVVNATVQNGFFTSTRGDHFQLNLIGTASSDLIFTGNTISNAHPAVVSGGGGIRLTGGSSGSNTTATYNISNNAIRDSNGTAIGVTKGAGAGTFTGTIDNNQIGVAAVTNSGSSAGSGISVILAETGSHTVSVTNNQIRQYNNFGIIVQAGGTATVGSGTLKGTVTGNTISNPGTAVFAKNGFQLNSGTLPGETYQVCLTFGGAGALRNTLVGSGTDGGTDFRLRQRQSTTVRLPGYAGANNDDAAVVTFAQVNNNLGGTPTGSATNTVPTGGGWIGGSCP